MCSDRRFRAASLVVFAALAATLFACGKQGDPHPRPRAVPEPAKDLTVRQRGSEVVLEFSYPTATVAGLPLERLEAAIVYEAAVPTLTGGRVPTLRDSELEGMAKMVLVLEGPALTEAIVGDKLSVRRELPPEALGGTDARVYAVRTKGPQGDVSPFSKSAGLKPRPEPPSPGALEVVAKSRGVAIRWTAPEGTIPRIEPVPVPTPSQPGSPTSSATAPPAATAVATPPATAPPAAPPGPPGVAAPAPTTPPATPVVAAPAVTAPVATTPPGLLPISGYVVLRREATNPRWGKPLAVVPPTELEYLDRSARYGTRYVYTVLTQLEPEPSSVESAPQSAREVDYRDVFAPTPPTELHALLVGNAVRLVWEPSPEDDLAGYWIERAEGALDYRRVNASLATGSDYTDPSPPVAGALRYRLVAVDKIGNVAAPTEPVGIDRP